MFLLYTDETNVQPEPGRFFLYGGIVIPCDTSLSLHDAIESVRIDNGYAPLEELKFNPRPDRLNHAQFIEVKRRVIQAAVDYGAKFLTDLILHDIATSSDTARRNAINRLAYHFDCFLHREHSHGLILVDRFHDALLDEHLREKFFVGVRGLPHTPTYRLGRIVGVHQSAIGQSHFPSIVDVAVGGFRWAINAFTDDNQGGMESARTIIRQLAPMFNNLDGTPFNLSLHLSPQQVIVDRYRIQYDALKAFCRENGISA